MSEYHEPLKTDSRSYESEDGDILPLELMVDPVQPQPDIFEYPMVHVPDSELDGPMIRMVNKALAEHAFRASINAKNALKDKDLDPATAMRLLHQETGFYARNAQEKGSMKGITGGTDRGAYPVLHYLDEVEAHQKNLKTEDPTDALRSIARHFENYAIQADTEAKFTRFFSDMARDRQFDLDQTISEVISSVDLENDEMTRRTLTSIVRLIEADRFANEGKGEYPLAVRNGIDSLKGDERQDAIFAMVGDMTVKDALQYNERLRTEEINRFEYWRKALIEARMRKSITAQVDESLEKLDKLRPRK